MGAPWAAQKFTFFWNSSHCREAGGSCWLSRQDLPPAERRHPPKKTTSATCSVSGIQDLTSLSLGLFPSAMKKKIP